ncbi:RdgB/HAM1 family non-canonical purine NTP pyrophosphatase [candidate division KSB1 bacterium]
MKRKLIIATKNVGKIREFKRLSFDKEFDIYSLIDLEDLPETNEDGQSFEENAVKKSESIYKLTGNPTIADDSGLEIDYLSGAPGVRSARFAGYSTLQNIKNEKIISMLDEIKPEERGAQFRCIIAFSDDSGTKTFEGICRGRISEEPKGTSGFGYDPIFIPDGYDKTFGELDEDIKNRISHRSKAIEKFYNWFSKNK